MMIFALGCGVAMAVEYKVGDEAGWTMKADYTQWAAGKKFHIGDILGNIHDALILCSLFLSGLSLQIIIIHEISCSFRIQQGDARRKACGKGRVRQVQPRGHKRPI